MGDPRYRRTVGGANQWRRLAWMPKKAGSLARMKSGAIYEMCGDGWRRRRDLEIAAA